jgi:hypothetical protein
MQALAREHTPAAIAALAAALGNPRQRVPAAVALLDRAWGKPTVVLAGDVERPAVIRFEWDQAHPQPLPEPSAATTIDAAAVAESDSGEARANGEDAGSDDGTVVFRWAGE